MDRPHCKICRHLHYSHEPHVWASRDFRVVEQQPAPARADDPPKKRGRPRRNVENSPPESKTAPMAPAAQPVERPLLARGGVGSIPAGRAKPRSVQQMKSRKRTPEAEARYRSYMQKYMQKRRARKEDLGS